MGRCKLLSVRIPKVRRVFENKSDTVHLHTIGPACACSEWLSGEGKWEAVADSEVIV